MVERQGLIVYIKQLKHAKSLRKFGHVHYISRKMKYVHLYTDLDDNARVKERIEKLPFVKKVEVSYRPFVDTEYETVRPDKAKEYDYKIGL
ncbi:YlbG family protein [Savagea faecisuis]|uniref:YlbG family protein n=1 Tax=Savagea faecisuis TaxID=1274803 RepID=A0ABW3GVI4_9BACL